MGLRMRKSVNLGGGVRLNMSRSGLGMSAGAKGFRVGVGPSGSRMNVGIPGTGIGYEVRGGNGSRRRRPARSAPQYAVAPNADSQPKRKRGFFGTIFWLLKWAIIAIVVLALIAAVL